MRASALLVCLVISAAGFTASAQPAPADDLAPVDAPPLEAPAPPMAADDVPPAYSPSAPGAPPPPPPVVVRQRPEPPRNGFHVNPLAMALGVFGVGYERVLHDHISLQIEGQYTNMYFTDDDTWGLGAQLKPFFFFFRQAPGGMYLSPRVSVAYARAHSGNVTGTGAGWSVGALIGYSWLIGRHLTIRAGGGIQYMSVKAEAEADSESGGIYTESSASIGFSGVLPALDFSLGFVF